MTRLVFIVGQTASGKSTYLRRMREWMENSKWGYVDNNIVVGYTSRPERDDEKYGEDYYFVQEDKIKKHCDVKREYNGWLYGYKLEDILSKKENYFACSPELAQDIVKKCVDRFYSLNMVYLKISEERQLERLQGRGDDIEELKRRIKDDKKSFDKRVKKLEQTMLKYCKEIGVHFTYKDEKETTHVSTVKFDRKGGCCGTTRVLPNEKTEWFVC